MKTIFITGATSGIGKATAETFAKQGHRLIICGRRKEVLEQLQIELSNITEVYSLVFDVRNQGGNIIKFIVKNDIYNTSILERELNLAHDEVEINESIEEDYIVQYTDVEGNNQIIGGNIIG